MAVKKKRSTVSAPRPRAPRRRTNRQAGTPLLPAERDIANLAYHLFLQRGGEHGHDWEDWLRAERELLLPIADQAS